MKYTITEREAERMAEGIHNMDMLIHRLQIENELLRQEIERLHEQNKELIRALTKS